MAPLDFCFWCFVCEVWDHFIVFVMILSLLLGGSGLLKTIKYASSVAVLSISRWTAPNIGGAQNPTGDPPGAVPVADR